MKINIWKVLTFSLAILLIISIFVTNSSNKYRKTIVHHAVISQYDDYVNLHEKQMASLLEKSINGDIITLDEINKHFIDWRLTLLSNIHTTYYHEKVNDSYPMFGNLYAIYPEFDPTLEFTERMRLFLVMLNKEIENNSNITSEQLKTAINIQNIFMEPTMSPHLEGNNDLYRFSEEKFNDKELLERFREVYLEKVNRMDQELSKWGLDR